MPKAQIRIIAGSLKGRRIAGPDWPGLRPTSDRLRESLFNVLAARFNKLFAGPDAPDLLFSPAGALTPPTGAAAPAPLEAPMLTLFSDEHLEQTELVEA